MKLARQKYLVLVVVRLIEPKEAEAIGAPYLTSWSR